MPALHMIIRLSCSSFIIAVQLPSLSAHATHCLECFAHFRSHQRLRLINWFQAHFPTRSRNCIRDSTMAKRYLDSVSGSSMALCICLCVCATLYMCVLAFVCVCVDSTTAQIFRPNQQLENTNNCVLTFLRDITSEENECE